MPEEKTLAWLGKHKERRALDLCKEHMDEIVDTVEAMRVAVHSFSENSDSIDEDAKRVVDSERDADEKKAEVLDELSKGNFPPLSREMIIRLVMTMDDIAENARATATKLTFLNPEDVGDEVKEGLKEVSDFAKEAVDYLEKAFSVLLYENPEEGIERTGKVEKMEEKVDHFRARRLLPEIVNWADSCEKSGTAGLLKEIEANIEEVVDQTENSADVIREIAIGSI